MAQVNGKFVRGAVGSFIYKKVGNKQYMMAKSKSQIAMTEATFNAAYVFGLASTFSSYVRDLPGKMIAYYDRGMVSRLTGQCNRIFQKISNGDDTFSTSGPDYFSQLNGFEFNENSPVKRCLFAQPQVSLTEEQVVIDLPEMQLPADLVLPAGATYCTLGFKVLLFDLDEKCYFDQPAQSVEIAHKRESFTFPAQQFIFSAAPKALCIVYVSLFFSEKTFAGNAVINSVQLSPAAILRAEYSPGEAPERVKWQNINFQKKKSRKSLKKPTITPSPR